MDGADLGGALVSLVRDLDPGLMTLIGAACYLLGLAAFVQGAMRLLRLSEDKFHGPSAAGTALCFLVCLVMVSFPSWLSAGGESLFGAGETAASASLGHGGRGRRLRRPAGSGAHHRRLGRAAGLPARRLRAARPPPTACPAPARAGPSRTCWAASAPGTSQD